MKILIAPDSFKECLDAFAVTKALAVGLRRSGIPKAAIIGRPLADGGEGLLGVLHHALKGEICSARVCGPMGKPVTANYGLLDNGRTAVIEMAQAAGLHLVSARRRNPGVATTQGVGELMLHALDLGVRRILIGLGGSATNDGGAGMATALGVCFKDDAGKMLPPGGMALSELDTVDTSGLDPRLQGVEVVAACDVTNLLCGTDGASYVYAPQKGASCAEVKKLDLALFHYAEVLRDQTGMDVATLAGGGAAGGLAAGLAAFAGATIRSGVEIVMEAYGDMDTQIAAADVVISGEGSVDGQSACGKVVAGLATKTKAHGKPLILVAGRISGNLETLYAAGVTAVVPITPEPMTRSVAIKKAKEHLEQTGETLGRLVYGLKC